MFPGYASRLYNEMEDLYKEKTLKIEPAKSDNGEKTSKSKSTKNNKSIKKKINKYCLNINFYNSLYEIKVDLI